MVDRATDPPLLSVIVPSFQQGQYLRTCIDSALRQDYRPIEIVVVDGASTDSTLDVLRTYADRPEVRWISEPDDGPASAVNKGLALARGDFASIQSADDYYLPGAFTRAMRAFRADAGTGLVYGEVDSVSESGERRSTSRRPAHDNALCIALCICIPQCSAFFRTALARELGGWRSQYHTCDWDLWLRMIFRTRVVKVDETLSCWRMYPGQRTDQRQRVYESFQRMLAESPEIRNAGLEVRRAALAGRQLIGLSYGARRDSWAGFTRLLAATLLYPRIWPHVPNKTRFVPGGRLLKRLRRLLSPAEPRTSPP